MSDFKERLIVVDITREYLDYIECHNAEERLELVVQQLERSYACVAMWSKEKIGAHDHFQVRIIPSMDMNPDAQSQAQQTVMHWIGVHA